MRRSKHQGSCFFQKVFKWFAVLGYQNSTKYAWAVENVVYPPPTSWSKLRKGLKKKKKGYNDDCFPFGQKKLFSEF